MEGFEFNDDDMQHTLRLARAVVKSMSRETEAICEAEELESLPAPVAISALMSAIGVIIGRYAEDQTTKATTWETVADRALAEAARALTGGYDTNERTH